MQYAFFHIIPKFYTSLSLTNHERYYLIHDGYVYVQHHKRSLTFAQSKCADTKALYGMVIHTFLTLSSHFSCIFISEHWSCYARLRLLFAVHKFSSTISEVGRPTNRQTKEKGSMACCCVLFGFLFSIFSAAMSSAIPRRRLYHENVDQFIFLRS